jgi:hypothetical protein
MRGRRLSAGPSGGAAGLEGALTAAVEAAPTASVLLSGGPASAALAVAARRPVLVARWPVGDDGGADAVAAWARGRGLAAVVVEGGPGDPSALLSEFLATLDLPSADGFPRHLLYRAAARAGVAGALDASGGAALFGVGEAFARMAEPARRPRGRGPRGPAGDPLDVAAQRAHEARALSRVPVHRAHSIQAFLPAATRAALSTLPARPPDGVVPAAAAGPGMAAALRVAAAIDGAERDADAQSRRADVRATLPWLAPGVLAAADALPPARRFGVPGSGGWLLEALGGAPPTSDLSFAPTLDAWLRGPLRGWLDATLARDRLAAQGVWRPDAVLEALRRWRAASDGWTARHLFLIAQVVHWIEREGLAGTAP